MPHIVAVVLVINYVLTPIWIFQGSRRAWPPSAEKAVILSFVIASAAVLIFLLSLPVPTSSVSLIWFSRAILTIIFTAAVVSAYFSWPRKISKEDQSLCSLPRKRTDWKNPAYVSVPSMNGSNGDVSVTILNAVFQQRKTVKHYPDPDFGWWLMDQIHNKFKMFAQKRGFFRKQFICSGCGTELNSNLAMPRRLEQELRYEDFNPFMLQITAPSVICPNCNKICIIDLVGSLDVQLGEAILAAFKSEKIKP